MGGVALDSLPPRPAPPSNLAFVNLFFTSSSCVAWVDVYVGLWVHVYAMLVHAYACMCADVHACMHACMGVCAHVSVYE